jgi:K+-transporting ATPase KdpF subunit
MTLTELIGWLGALGALALFVYLGYALLRPELF